MFNRALQAAKRIAKRAAQLAKRAAQLAERRKSSTAPVPNGNILVSRRTPAYMLPGFGVREHYRGKMKPGLHVTAKTHRGVKCRMSVGENPDHHIERLQMLKDRKERRNARQG